MKRGESYKNDLLKDLRNDPDYAAKYLTAARADSKEAFLVALRDVAEARKGMKKVAKEAKVNRENLYRALSRRGNPRIETVDSVLDALGLEAVFRPRKRKPHCRVAQRQDREKAQLLRGKARPIKIE